MRSGSRRTVANQAVGTKLPRNSHCDTGFIFLKPIISSKCIRLTTLGDRSAFRSGMNWQNCGISKKKIWLKIRMKIPQRAREDTHATNSSRYSLAPWERNASKMWPCRIWGWGGSRGKCRSLRVCTRSNRRWPVVIVRVWGGDGWLDVPIWELATRIWVQDKIGLDAAKSHGQAECDDFVLEQVVP